MATVHETRHLRLLQLIKEAGTIQALADKLGKSHSQISQLRNQVAHSTTGRKRVVGDDLAREIEDKLKLPAGWMDSLAEVAPAPAPPGATTFGRVVADLATRLQGLAPTRRKLIAGYAAEVLEHGPSDDTAETLDDLARGIQAVGLPAPPRQQGELAEFLLIAKQWADQLLAEKSPLTPAQYIARLSSIYPELLQAHRAEMAAKVPQVGVTQ